MNKRVALVTGGCRGIGRAIALLFAETGYEVVALDVAPEPVQGIQVLECDVSDWDQVQAAVSTVARRFGRIDALVNNAGIGAQGDFYNSSIDQWQKVLGVNLNGAYYCAKVCAPHMKAGGGGAIVNIASTRALMSEPNSEPYAASKGGLLSLTHALAVTLGHDGIRVNAICPGWIDTTGGTWSEADQKQHPAGRVGEPGDIARACLFLCDPANSFITGQHLVIDGGMTIKMIYV